MYPARYNRSLAAFKRFERFNSVTSCKIISCGDTGNDKPYSFTSVLDTTQHEHQLSRGDSDTAEYITKERIYLVVRNRAAATSEYWSSIAFWAPKNAAYAITANFSLNAENDNHHNIHVI
jgi:hypothetical protein